MPLPEDIFYTLEDIYKLPDGTRAELIEGQIFYMAPPSTTHQRILSFLHLEIGEYIRENHGSCEIFPAPFAVFLPLKNTDKETEYLEPDISVICDPDKLDEKGCHGAPDWVIEIVLPSSKRMDYYTKLSLYLNAGIREYWIVDPIKRTVVVYHMEENEGPAIYSFKNCIPAAIYDNLTIDFSKLNI